MSSRFLPVAAIVLASLGLIGTAPAARAATGHADVRLVRLLEEVPDSERTALGPVKDLRLRLEPGNMVVFKQRGEFAAIFPLDRVATAPESLRYFYYLERPATFWIFPGAREKGIRTVADGGAISVNSFRLLWRGGVAHGGGAGGEAGAAAASRSLGRFYFPDAPENEGLAFSVVSGSTVGLADPKDTKYWIELGAPRAASVSGF